MAPQRTIGIRELRNGLNRYVEEVGRGAEITVTVRGKPVARIEPVDREDPLEDLRRRGLIQEPTRPRTPIRMEDLVEARGSVSDLVRDQRR